MLRYRINQLAITDTLPIIHTEIRKSSFVHANKDMS